MFKLVKPNFTIRYKTSKFQNSHCLIWKTSSFKYSTTIFSRTINLSPERYRFEIVLKRYAQLRAPSDNWTPEPLVYKTSALTTELVRHLTTTDFLSVCILLVKLYWTTKRVIVKKWKTTINQYEVWSLENTKWLWGSLAHICIVIALQLHYCILHRSSVIIMRHYGSHFIFSLSRAELYISVSNKPAEI